MLEDPQQEQRRRRRAAPGPCRSGCSGAASPRRCRRRTRSRATAAAIISTSVQTSTLTIAMKMSASTSVGAVWPTLSVPGMRSSRTSPVNLKIAVVGANEPMPSVSKKFVTNPIASPSGVGAGESSPVAPRARPRSDSPAERDQVGNRHEEQADEKGGLHGGRVYSRNRTHDGPGRAAGSPRRTFPRARPGRGCCEGWWTGCAGRPRRRPRAIRRRLGRYRILHRLGQGGMGIVFAAEDESLGRKVAVKTIAEPDESARKRFRREARAAAGVNHPNVCQVYEIGEDGGQLFIAMELLEGESLADRLQRGPLTVAEAVPLGARDAGRARGAPRERHRPPRPQALERLPHPARREAARLRPRAPAAARAHAVARDRHRAHAARPARGHAALHGARAGARPRRRRPHRPLRGRGDPVRGARGPPGVPGHERRRGAVGHAPRAAARARRGRRRGRRSTA